MRFFPLYLFLLGSFCVFSQGGSFIWPIDSPRVITGNYGELRPNHFHAGMDFSTNGEVNLQVYAAEEGYVSRIRVSPVGYGKSVYITHPNGLVTVYAHLNSFSLKIDKVVRAEQLAQQSFEVELLQRPGFMPVRKNEIIGLSGNTGGSTGPHLHFEIRDAVTETPLNPLLFYKVGDTTLPALNGIGIYDLSDTCSPKFLTAVRVSAHEADSGRIFDEVVIDRSIIGIAFSGFDRLIPKGNPNNIFAARLYLDGGLIYAHELKAIDFADSRFVNEFSENVNKIKYQKCFLPTVYPSRLYFNIKNKGRIDLKDTALHELRLEVSDERGNERSIRFGLRTSALNTYSSPNIKSDLMVQCDKDFLLKKEGLQIFIAANTLFYTTPLIIENTIESSGKLIVLPGHLNLRSPASLGLKVPERYQNNKSKLVLRNGINYATSILRNDSVFFMIKNFGWLQLEVDTTGPVIKTLLKNKKIKKLKNVKAFTFLISDYASGINKYSMFINDKWVLAEYDAKSDQLTYTFDEETPGGTLKFRVTAEDRSGNKSEFNFNLTRR